MQKLKTILICAIFFFLCVIPAYREVGVVYAQPEKSVVSYPWPGKPKNLTEDTQFDGDVTGKYNDLQIKEGVVGSQEVADSSVTAQDLADGSVSKEKIQDNAITTQKLTDNSVTDEKVSNDITVSNYLPLIGGSLTGALNVQGNLGIGTTSPGYKLEVAGSIRGTSLEVSPSPLSGGVLEGDGPLRLRTYASSESIAMMAGDNMIFQTYITESDWTETMRIDNTGNVGIGTVSPGAKLTVLDTTGNGIVVRETDDGNDAVKINSNTGDGAVHLYSNGIERIFLRSEGDSYITGGNLGIGTTGPNSKLHVEGAVGQWAGNFRNSGGSGLLVGAGTNSSDWSFQVENAAGSIPYFAVRGDGNIGIGTANPTSLNNRDRVLELNATAMGSSATPGLVLRAGVLYSNPAWEIMLGLAGQNETSFNISSGTTNVLHIRNSGNVGIGNIEPSEKLQVSGNIKADSFLGDGSQLSNIQATSINPESNITVAKLDVRSSEPGGYLISALGTSDTYFQFSTGTLAGTKVYFGQQGQSEYNEIYFGYKWKIGGWPTPDFVLNYDGTDVLTVKQNGNVGIGTANPSGKLHVESIGGELGLPAIVLKGTTTGSYQSIDFYGGPNIDASNRFQIAQWDSGTAILYNVGNQPIDFYTNSSPRVRIDSNGNVGIGTNTPTKTLDVGGNGKMNLGVAGVSHGYINTPQHLYVNIDSNNDCPGCALYINTGGEDGQGTNLMTVASSGNVGIGTVSPGAKLTVLDTTGNGIVVRETDDGNDAVKINSNTGDGAVHLYSNGIERIFLRSEGDSYITGGKVGIGTASPQAKLDVDGAIKIGSVSLDSNAARGTITFDDEFIYVKTSGGWKKARLCSLD